MKKSVDGSRSGKSGRDKPIQLRMNRDRKGYLFIMPYFIVLILLQLYPIISTALLSFQTSTNPFNPYELQFAGLANYDRLLTRDADGNFSLFYKTIGNTWWIWLWNFVPQIFFAVVLAVILTNRKVRGAVALRTIYFLPNLVTMASIGLLFNVLMDYRYGTLNYMLMDLGILKEPFYWLIKPKVAQGTVSFIQWWQWFGYTMIIMMAGLSAINDDLYEAANIDGAGNTQVFFRITLPMLRPTMLYVMITSLIGGMQIFDIPKVLTDGRGKPDNALSTMVLYLYNQAFKFNNVGYAAAVAWALFFIILFFSILAFRAIGGRREN